MRAAILYILVFCSWFLGVQQPVSASGYPTKAHHCVIKKQLLEKQQTIDADENDEEDLTKKVTTPAKWLPVFNYEILLNDYCGYLGSFSPGFYAGGSREIFLFQRVLRI
ncbi:MAG: hypothetical protein JNK79_14015 [Chitinophagaceae bacterium]|nr:hypothetical protein [Chitinophagaceae bacterium]